MTTRPHAEIIDDYLTDLRRRTDSGRTLETYAATLWRAHEQLPLGLPLATTEEIAAWLHNEQWSRATRNLRRTIFRDFGAWAVRAGRLDRDEAAKLDRIKQPRRWIPPATTAEVRTILDLTHGVNWLASLLAAYQGLRCIEISRQRRDDITAELLMVRQGKGGHQRQIPTHQLVWRAVVDLPAGLLVPVVSRTGSRPERLLSSRLWRAYRRVGVETSIHKLRKWYATELWRADVDLETIRQLLGHRSLTTTQQYLGVDPERMARAVATLPVLTADGPGSGGRSSGWTRPNGTELSLHPGRN